MALSLKDGTPHVTPLWFDYDGQYIVLNSARDRVKDRVMRRSGLVAMAISDPENPPNYEISEKNPINLYIPNIEFTTISSVQRKWNFALI